MYAFLVLFVILNVFIASPTLGTGCAPFRGFIQERAAQGGKGKLFDNIIDIVDLKSGCTCQRYAVRRASVKQFLVHDDRAKEGDG